MGQVSVMECRYPDLAPLTLAQKLEYSALCKLYREHTRELLHWEAFSPPDLSKIVQ